MDASNPVSSQYLVAKTYGEADSYNLTFDDPMSDMILMANELAFRTAYTFSTSQATVDSLGLNMTQKQYYIVSPNLTDIHRSTTQEATVRDSSLQTVYATHRGWLAGGFVVMVLACLAILPTYWGWWNLGREVSMSPLEIARAFGAPVMPDADPNATGGDIKRSMGDEKVSLNPARVVGVGVPLDRVVSEYSSQRHLVDPP